MEGDEGGGGEREDKIEMAGMDSKEHKQDVEMKTGELEVIGTREDVREQCNEDEVMRERWQAAGMRL